MTTEEASKCGSLYHMLLKKLRDTVFWGISTLCLMRSSECIKMEEDSVAVGKMKKWFSVKREAVVI